MRRELLLVAAACAAPLYVSAQSPIGTLEHAAASITAEDIYERVGVMAHDSMMGRDTPSPGLDMTAAYIAAEFSRMGLLPGGDKGSFIQRYPLRTTQLAVDRSTVKVDRGPTWRVGPDLLVRFGSLSETVTGPVVVVDGGSVGMEAIERTDMTGAVVVLTSSSDRRFYRTVQAIYNQGASAVIQISQRSDNAWAGMSQRQGRASTRKGWGESGSSAVLLEIREAAIAPVLNDHGFELAPALQRAERPFSVRRLRDLRLTIDLQYAALETTSAPNVVGILEGSNPVLKNEYVLFSAHMDHVGVGGSVDGDSIYNGADDDASGTAAIIEVAEAYTMLTPRPERSMIFLAVSGEEKGLWGSEYFAENPYRPIDQIVANLNSDMVSRNWSDTVVVIGKEHSDLGETMNRVNAEHPELNMHAIDDIWPEERFYFRSDHFNFARKGVPILFFFTGTHEDYHQVSDELEKINADKAARITQLIFHLGLEIANNPEKPKWDPESYNQIVEPVP
jgi:hypothetical protein